MWLLRRHIKTTRPSSKLDVRRLGPYVVIGQVGTSAHRLAPPASLHIHPVFHVSLLEPHVANTFPDRVVVPPLPTHVDGLPEFEVKKILDSRYFYRKLQYLVDWVGYNDSERSWQPVENLSNADIAIRKFHTKFLAKPRPRA